MHTVQSHLESLLRMNEHWCDITGMSEQLAYELHQTVRGTYGMYLCSSFFIFVHFLLLLSFDHFLLSARPLSSSCVVFGSLSFRFSVLVRQDGALPLSSLTVPGLEHLVKNLCS